jgi:hypothetical protein
MSHRLSLAFLSVFVFGLSIMFAPRPALAVNCDVNVCIAYCQKTGPQAGLGNYLQSKLLANDRSAHEKRAVQVIAR